MKNKLYVIIVLSIIINLIWCQKTDNKKIIEEQNNEGIVKIELSNTGINKENDFDNIDTWSSEIITTNKVWEENSKKNIKKTNNHIIGNDTTKNTTDPVAERYCTDNKWTVENYNICNFWENKNCSFIELKNWTCKWVDYSEWTAVYIEENDFTEAYAETASLIDYVAHYLDDFKVSTENIF